MWDQDGRINVGQLVQELSDVAVLQNKYFKIMNLEKMKLRKLTNEHKKMLRLKMDYYLGVLDDDTLKQYNWPPYQVKVLRTELPSYLDADDDLCSMQFKLELSKTKIDYLESIIKLINFRTQTIRGIQSQVQFDYGINAK